jgi:DUF4097 and DUF4098 domain-containing protein YvlB
MNTITKTLTVLIILAAGAGIAVADRAVNESRPLVADGRVEVSNISGEVTVTGWSGSEVVITGTLDSGVEELEIHSSPSRVAIEVSLERRTRNGSAMLEIKMPSTAGLEVETVSADITVDGVAGDLTLESVSGRIEISGDARSIEAASVSGDVRVASTSNRAQLESVSGDIIVRHAAGRLEADVVSGNIEIEGGVLDGFSGETVSGSIHCAALPSERGRFTIESMSGRVEMVVPEGINADFSIETYSGAIKNDIGPAPVRTDTYGPGKELRFSSGSGGARVTIESFSGSVALRTN